MLCQNCGKNPATTHLKRTINGETAELHLCAACAKKQGLDNMWNSFGFDLGDFWGSLFADPSARVLADSVRCEGCGKSFEEIAKSGKAGCPSCYTTFYDRLLPSIQRIHGKARHTGKVPPQAGEPLRRERELEELKKQLADAIASQEYEKCAELRDRIHGMEGEQHEED